MCGDIISPQIFFLIIITTMKDIQITHKTRKKLYASHRNSILEHVKLRHTTPNQAERFMAAVQSAIMTGDAKQLNNQRLAFVAGRFLVILNIKSPKCSTAFRPRCARPYINGLRWRLLARCCMHHVDHVRSFQRQTYLTFSPSSTWLSKSNWLFP